MIKKFRAKTFLPVFLFLTISVITHAQTDGERSWVTIDMDAMTVLETDYVDAIDLLVDHTVQTSIEPIAVVGVLADDLDKLTDIMHEEFNRCSGYIYHGSYSEAADYAAGLADSQNSVETSYVYTIDNPDGVAVLMSEVSTDAMTYTVEKLISFQNRHYQSLSGVDSAIWLQDYWREIVADRPDIEVELQEHDWQQPTISVTIPGSVDTNATVILGAHIDAISAGNHADGIAPGAEDNASGIAVLTETLRTIAATNYIPEATVRILIFSGGEEGLRSSNQLASLYRMYDLNVIGMTQFDKIGYRGAVNTDIVFADDYTNPAQNQFMASLLDTYHQNVLYSFSECGWACSDHVSWFNQGYPTSALSGSTIENRSGLAHTEGDVLFDENYALNFAKLSLTYVAELAKGEGTIVIDPTPTPTPTPTVDPTPTPTVDPTPTPTVDPTPTPTVDPTPTPTVDPTPTPTVDPTPTPTVDPTPTPTLYTTPTPTVVPTPTPTPQPEVAATLYQHCGYGGYSVALGEGSYTLGQLQALGMTNDDVSAISVAPGYQVSLYQHDFFGGYRLVRRTNDDCFVNEYFNDQLSSVVISKAPALWTETFQAEAFVYANGVEIQPGGSGQATNVLNSGDWLVWSVNIPASGSYRVSYHVSSTSGGTIQMERGGGQPVYGTVNVPVTGGPNLWTTVSHDISLSPGPQYLAVYVPNGGYRLDWIKVDQL